MKNEGVDLEMVCLLVDTPGQQVYVEGTNNGRGKRKYGLTAH
jgi:hypothetical protein